MEHNGKLSLQIGGLETTVFLPFFAVPFSSLSPSPTRAWCASLRVIVDMVRKQRDNFRYLISSLDLRYLFLPSFSTVTAEEGDEALKRIYNGSFPSKKTISYLHSTA